MFTPLGFNVNEKKNKSPKSVQMPILTKVNKTNKKNVRDYLLEESTRKFERNLTNGFLENSPLTRRTADTDDGLPLNGSSSYCIR